MLEKSGGKDDRHMMVPLDEGAGRLGVGSISFAGNAASGKSMEANALFGRFMGAFEEGVLQA